MDKHIITKEQAEQIVKEVFTVADFCRKVGWQPRGENYRVFYKYVKDYNLDISHFTGKKQISVIKTMLEFQTKSILKIINL